MVDFGRDTCGRLETAQKREWLVTNGIGGFGMGTLAGIRTRRYHGLLVAALQPPVDRHLLLAKLDDTAVYLRQPYPLFDNQWADGTVEPGGHRFMERFHLEGSVPTWTYALADALLEKRIWMEHGANTTYVHYHMVRGTEPLLVTARALVAFRDFHHTTRAGSWEAATVAQPNGLEISFTDEVKLYLLSGPAAFTPVNQWLAGFYLAEEAYRGQADHVEDLYCAAEFRLTLRPGETACVVAGTHPHADLNGEEALARRRARDRRLLDLAAGLEGPPEIGQLALAADQFVVRRPLGDEQTGRSVIAGYPWFADWGRDTMIALPGLALVTGRSEVAATILRTFARSVDRGMLPNRFPDRGESPEYNTVDATLWYFEAVRAYLDHTNDEELVAELYPILVDIIEWHGRGTRYQIHLDARDGLIYAGERGVQLTWMDAKVGGWVVTPRIGKPVEVNALWYNALCCLVAFSRRLGLEARRYELLAQAAEEGFQRFWDNDLGHCRDVLDGPNGDEPSLRPNQLLAVSLPHSPLQPWQQKAVVEACGRRLFTSHGLRTLDPEHRDYVGGYGGDLRQRDAAYHQGTVWGWLIGPFVAAHLRVYRDPAAARSLLGPLLRHLGDHGVGSLSEIFDGDAPFTARGCPAQAWTVAEVLRVWQLTRG
jgi:predicted glycogen debranching enzyme